MNVEFLTLIHCCRYVVLVQCLRGRWPGLGKNVISHPFFSNFSAATLPTTNRCVEENNNVGPLICRFMLPLGATVNMDDSALYRDVTTIFVAQLKDITLSPGTRFKFQLCPHHTSFLWRLGTKNHTVQGFCSHIRTVIAALFP